MELKLMIMMPYIYLQAPTQLNEWVYCFNSTESHSLGDHRRENQMCYNAIALQGNK